MTQTNRGICPACNGTLRRPCPDHLRQYGAKNGWYNYRAADDTIACHNCGSQYMHGSPSGEVTLRPDGTPCTHAYVSESQGRCYTRYTCKHCSEVFHIDSSD